MSDIRYLLKLGASGKGEEVGLSETVEFTPLWLCLRVNMERRTTLE